MEHKTEKFKFVNNDGKIEDLFSKTYSFKIQEILENRFGKEVLQEFRTKRSLTASISLQDVTEDFPKLLSGDVNNLDWKEQDYDEILRVYLFFILYEQNAMLRQLQSEKEILASVIETLKKTFDLNQENNSQIMN